MALLQHHVLSVALETEAETSGFGAWLAPRLQAGDAVLLSGSVGAGKTHLARALIRARLNNPGADVPSPTFTLVQTYEASDVAIWHADLYRIRHASEVIELGLEEAFDTTICLVEWPDRLGTFVPADPIDITLAEHEEGRVATLRFARRPALVAGLRSDWTARDA